MIAHLRGQILYKIPSYVVIDCGGVGYELLISVATYTELGEVGAEARLHVHTHVREDALQLFGFYEVTEKRLFEKLLTISGIGPKLAITVLSGISAERLVGAIRGGDHATLTKIPGIGKKTAERVVLELKDKLDDMAGYAPAADAKPSLGAIAEDVLSALVNLGYPRPVAHKAVEAAAKDASAAGDFERLFRAAIVRFDKMTGAKEAGMKIQWTKLPFVFDAKLLQQDLSGIAETEWVPHFNARDYEGRWSSVALRSRSGLIEDSVPMGTAAEFRDTPLMARCLHMKAAVDAFAFEKKSVRLLRLQAGSRVREHVDRDLGLEAGELRLHVPVVTNDRLEFVVAGRQLKLAEGQSWYIDFSQPHRIYNGGETDRVHLIIDGEANDAALAMLQRATEEMVTESFEPAGAAAFERFRELVFDDAELQEQLLKVTAGDVFMKAVVAAGVARGYVFGVTEVESVYRRSAQAWSTRTGEA